MSNICCSALAFYLLATANLQLNPRHFHRMLGLWRCHQREPSKNGEKYLDPPLQQTEPHSMSRVSAELRRRHGSLYICLIVFWRSCKHFKQKWFRKVQSLARVACGVGRARKSFARHYIFARVAGVPRDDVLRRVARLEKHPEEGLKEMESLSEAICGAQAQAIVRAALEVGQKASGFFSCCHLDWKDHFGWVSA